MKDFSCSCENSSTTHWSSAAVRSFPENQPFIPPVVRRLKILSVMGPPAYHGARASPSPELTDQQIDCEAGGRESPVAFFDKAERLLKPFPASHEGEMPIKQLLAKMQILLILLRNFGERSFFTFFIRRIPNILCIRRRRTADTIAEDRVSVRLLPPGRSDPCGPP
jgi:hypothetical protein